MTFNRQNSSRSLSASSSRLENINTPKITLENIESKIARSVSNRTRIQEEKVNNLNRYAQEVQNRALRAQQIEKENQERMIQKYMEKVVHVNIAKLFYKS